MKVIAFDVFGTVFDLAGVPREEIKAYADHLKAHRAEWSPLTLPTSWETLPAHPDSKPGIELLREKYFVVTCSNGPLGMLSKLSKHNDIRWDCIIPLELNRVFKPDPRAYLTICDVLGCAPQDVLMVTANEHFGDLEGAQSVGMKSILIRKEIPTIVDLAQMLR